MVWFIVLFVALASNYVVNGANMGSKGIVTLKEGSACKINYDAKSVIEVKDKNKDEMIVNGTLDFPIEINDKSSFLFLVDKWEKSSWQKDFMKITGKACDKINQLVPGFVKRISKFTKPALGDQCPFKKGKYQVINLKNIIDTNEINVPTVPFGKFRFLIQVRDKDNKLTACVKFDSAIIEPK